MSVSLIWEKADGQVVKGLTDCETPSANTKQVVDTDLNHGVVTPGSFTVPQPVVIKTFSWANNGDPDNAITNVGIYLDNYYTTGPTYEAETGKVFCGGGSSAAFGNYQESGGTHTASADYTNIIQWGDDGYGVQISLDRGRTYTTIKTGVGDSIGNPITLAATAMDIGNIDGQLEPGDRAVVYVRIGIPPSFTNVNDAGIYLFNLGLVYAYTA